MKGSITHLDAERNSTFRIPELQIIRVVVDTINRCNKQCDYCHPLLTGWTNEYLPFEKIIDLFVEIEARGYLEVTLTGGEVTLHPDFCRILDGTHNLRRTVSSLITNGLTMSQELRDRIRDSNVSRICVSLDGSDRMTHNSARTGDDFEKVMNTLCALRQTGKNVTVISVAHQINYRRLMELSHLLADKGLADQHHLCAPSFSGLAKENYERLRMKEDDFHRLQDMVDDEFCTLMDKGLYVTFNSYWPAVGKRGRATTGRQLTLIQLNEQQKDCYVILRPNGDIRLTAASWGRETVGNAVLGNVNESNVSQLLQLAEEIYRNRRVYQLPREIEAQHKFLIGEKASSEDTRTLLTNKELAHNLVGMIPIKPLSNSEILRQDIDSAGLEDLSNRMLRDPNRYRIVRNPSGVYLVFDRQTTWVTLLHEQEMKQIVLSSQLSAII